MKIKVKLHNNATLPNIVRAGDWIDLSLIEDLKIKGPISTILKRKQVYGEEVKERKVVFSHKKTSFGIAMELPEGYEAIIAPRSSTYPRYNIVLSNSVGVIDNAYNGDNDVWGADFIAFKDVDIPKGIRVAQFRIQLSQKATWWQKIKWLFTSKIQFVPVDTLNNDDRGGFGSTGK